MMDTTEKLFSPLLFPAGLLAAAWLLRRIQNPDREIQRANLRFWLGSATVIACGEYAVAWHNEIGSAWQTSPALTLLGTFIAFLGIVIVAPSLSSFEAILPANPPPQQRRTETPLAPLPLSLSLQQIHRRGHVVDSEIFGQNWIVPPRVLE
jgi:hypothetical protein